MMLGEKIHQLRKARGLSQEELAGQLTISRQAISKWELGESVPDTENVVQLSKIFGVSTDYLLNDEFESDNDLPAVRVSNEHIKLKHKMRARILSYCILGVALLIGTFFATHTTAVVADPHPYDVVGEPYLYHQVHFDFYAILLFGVLLFIGIFLLLYSFNVLDKMFQYKNVER